jgi:hypothetical protein
MTLKLITGCGILNADRKPIKPTATSNAAGLILMPRSFGHDAMVMSNAAMLGGIVVPIFWLR